MPKLKCSRCGKEKEVPICCEKSMVIQDGMLCCCSDGCHHIKIPNCCGQEMYFL